MNRLQSIINCMVGVFLTVVVGMYWQTLPGWAFIGLGLSGFILIFMEIWKRGGELGKIKISTFIAVISVTVLLTTVFTEYGGKYIVNNFAHSDLEQSEIDIYNRPLPNKINEYITTKYKRLLKEYGIRKIYVNEPAAINLIGYTRVYDDTKQYSYQNLHSGNEGNMLLTIDDEKIRIYYEYSMEDISYDEARVVISNVIDSTIFQHKDKINRIASWDNSAMNK